MRSKFPSMIILSLPLWLINGNSALSQFALGKQIDCTSQEVRQKLMPLLTDFVMEQVRQFSIVHGTPPVRISNVQVVASTLEFTGAPAVEGMLYEQCLVTGAYTVQSADGTRTGRAGIPNLPVKIGYDRQGVLHAQISPNGKVY